MFLRILYRPVDPVIVERVIEHHSSQYNLF